MTKHTVRDALPRSITEIENTFIRLSDGTRLAARIWLPADAHESPVPAILEYIPYRKRDFMRGRDEPMHRYFAGHGYAAVRVDLRGSGDSDGLLLDEYLPREQQDALEVIEWLTEQPWCDGNVGMTGISWGGFNALQVAAHRPPALKAIITLCSSDDRYSDDAHFMGGCLLNENQIWGTVLFALNALPPDPEIVGARWREMWFDRLEHDYPFPALWLQHQNRDAYWQQGSICEDPQRIVCPVFAIGGWADGYSNAVPRLLEQLECPRKGLIGPWAHTFPHLGVPGPAIGYLQEAVRWWGQWLKGQDTGITAEPMLRVWMQDSVAPKPLHEIRPGRWVAEPVWPSPNIELQPFYFGPAALRRERSHSGTRVDVFSPQTTGSTAGDWCGFGVEGEAPMDQRADDGRSAIFDTDPLNGDYEILGAPSLRLSLCSDSRHALIAVRLNDVAPDGTSLLVSYGLLNLTHRDGHVHPRELEPGRRYDIDLELNYIAHRFPAGHILRVAISTNYWPLVWPAAEPARITLELDRCSLTLPHRPPCDADRALKPFAAPESAAASSQQTPLRPPRFVRRFERDLTTHETVYRLTSEGGDLESGAVVHVDAIDMDLGHTVERRFTIGETDPLTAAADVEERLMMRRPGWTIQVQASTRLTADAKRFKLEATLRASENGADVFERSWTEYLDRCCV